jgi:hypothetical protein
MVRQQRNVAAKNALNMTMQVLLGVARQQFKQTTKAFATTRDSSNMILKDMDSAVMEMNHTTEAVIQVKVNNVTIPTVPTNLGN